MKLYCMRYDFMFDDTKSVGRQSIEFVIANCFEDAMKTLVEYHWATKSSGKKRKSGLSRFVWGESDNTKFVIDNIVDEESSFLAEVELSDISSNVLKAGSYSELDFDYHDRLGKIRE